jgi:hypothetical protein
MEKDIMGGYKLLIQVLLMNNLKFSKKELRGLTKPTRVFDVYTGLDIAMKTFSSLMPLVT